MCYGVWGIKLFHEPSVRAPINEPSTYPKWVRTTGRTWKWCDGHEHENRMLERECELALLRVWHDDEMCETYTSFLHLTSGRYDLTWKKTKNLNRKAAELEDQPIQVRWSGGVPLIQARALLQLLSPNLQKHFSEKLEQWRPCSN